MSEDIWKLNDTIYNDEMENKKIQNNLSNEIENIKKKLKDYERQHNLNTFTPNHQEG